MRTQRPRTYNEDLCNLNVPKQGLRESLAVTRALLLPVVSVITVFIGTSDCLPPREITLFIIKKLSGYTVLTATTYYSMGPFKKMSTYGSVWYSM